MTQAMPKLICEAERHGKILKAYVDGSHDSSSIYELLEAQGVDAVIKPSLEGTVV
jgi:hypothetical protein